MCAHVFDCQINRDYRRTDAWRKCKFPNSHFLTAMFTTAKLQFANQDATVQQSKEFMEKTENIMNNLWAQAVSQFAQKYAYNQYNGKPITVLPDISLNSDGIYVDNSKMARQFFNDNILYTYFDTAIK